MKIKLDENLPFALVARLNALGHDTDSVPQEGLAGFADSSVWQAAQNEGRFFIAQDLDFSDLRAFAPGTHGGILLLRLSDPTRQAITSCVETVFQMEAVEDWTGCFVVVTERKIRGRYPDA